jgi:uncharacterized protein YndB with AHSA1/START domain
MSDPDFIHVIYIRATPEAIWTALTDGGSSVHFWAGRTNESTWTTGAPLTMRAPDGGIDFTGEVLESDPPHLLRYTFHVSGPGPMHDEGPTEVCYRIEPSNDVVRLTVTHSGFRDDSVVREGISGGWPRILSGLKSFIETGRGFDSWSRADEG